MSRITVLGGTGYGGAAVVREAVRRGHDVRSWSRTAPSEPVPGASYATGSVTDESVRADVVKDTDVVFVALSPRGDMAGRVEPVVDRLVELAEQQGVRLGVLGGASSLLVEEGGPRLFDVHQPPAEVLDEVKTGLNLLEALRSSPEGLDWFYVSPPLEFGSWAPAPVTGSYRISDDVLLREEDGQSRISADDLAVAVVDEVESGAHRRRRFHVAL